MMPFGQDNADRQAHRCVQSVASATHRLRRHPSTAARCVLDRRASRGMLGSMSLAPRESQRILDNSYQFLVISINSEYHALPLAAPSLSRHLGSIFAELAPSGHAWLVASELFFAGEKVCSRYFGALRSSPAAPFGALRSWAGGQLGQLRPASELARPGPAQLSAWLSLARLRLQLTAKSPTGRLDESQESLVVPRVSDVYPSRPQP